MDLERERHPAVPLVPSAILIAIQSVNTSTGQKQINTFAEISLNFFRKKNGLKFVLVLFSYSIAILFSIILIFSFFE